MIVGYIDQEEHVFCADCWRIQATEGGRPSQILDDEEPDDPGDNFWIVDPCSSCGRQVKHKALTTLN